MRSFRAVDDALQLTFEVGVNVRLVGHIHRQIEIDELLQVPVSVRSCDLGGSNITVQGNEVGDVFEVRRKLEELQDQTKLVATNAVKIVDHYDVVARKARGEPAQCRP